MDRHYYWCTQRPAVPGAIPRGVVSIEDFDNKTVPETGHRAYSLIGYNRALTEQEIRDYELTPCADLKGDG